MSYTYGHEAAKKKNDMNTYRNLVRKGIGAKKAKKLGMKSLGRSPGMKDYIDVARTTLELSVFGGLVKDRPKEFLEPLVPVWEDRNRSNNKTKLNP